MKRLTFWVVRKYIPNSEQINNPEVRANYGYLEGWVSILVNIVLFVIKFTLGMISASIALIADAFHTLSDMITSVVIVISFKITKKPSDFEHPFGHQRVEAISTIVIATLLSVTGLELCKSAVDRILHPIDIISNWWIIGAIFLTAIIKEMLSQFAWNLGDKINSENLKADFWHHRSDVFATLLVLAAFILGRFQILPHLDGYIGIGVALLIMYTGFDVAKGSVNHLLGSAPEPEYLQKVLNLATSHPEVTNAHDIILHQYGGNKILSLHIEISDKLSLDRAHQIAEKIEEEIRNELKTHTTVHFEPINSINPLIARIRQIIRTEIEKDPRLQSYHALRTTGKKIEPNVEFDLVVRRGTTATEIENIRTRLNDIIKNSGKNIGEVIIKIEPSYSFQTQLP